MRVPNCPADVGAAATTGPGERGPTQGAAAGGSGRRGVLAAGTAWAASAGLAPPLSSPAAAQGGTPPAQQAPRSARPAAGDTLVFATGERSGRPVGLSDLEPGGPQVLAWAVDPASGTVRNGSRLNQVVLIRLDPATLDEATAARAVNGVVAYSAVCTHAQCPVSEWRREAGVLHCPCHQSEFDPKQGGKVVGGPAQRPLAALPLKAADPAAGPPPAPVAEAPGADSKAGAGSAPSPSDALVVAKPFTGRVGASS